MMKTKKEEAIRKAYGEYWEQVKPFIDDEGWMYRIDFPTKHKIELEEHPNQYHIRPKSLQGIENNNGWIRIESEEYLPNDLTECYVYDDDGDITYFTFGINESNEFMYLSEQGITHYQPIVKPKPPIY